MQKSRKIDHTKATKPRASTDVRSRKDIGGGGGGGGFQLLNCVQLFATPWIAAHQASQSIINSKSLLKLMFIELVMPSSHLILCHPHLLPPSIFPSIRVFSNEAVLLISWPKYWSFSFSITPSNKYSGLISFRMDGWDLFAVQGTLGIFSNTTVQEHQFFSSQLSLESTSIVYT